MTGGIENTMDVQLSLTDILSAAPAAMDQAQLHQIQQSVAAKPLSPIKFPISISSCPWKGTGSNESITLETMFKTMFAIYTYIGGVIYLLVH